MSQTTMKAIDIQGGAMTDKEFDAIVRAQEDEIEQRLTDLDACEVRFREVDGPAVLAMLHPSPPSRTHTTFLLSRRERGEITHEWADEIATELFLLYVTQYSCWRNPTHGAVSPALGDFFTYCNPEVPALVNWARWLRIQHESDEGIDTFDLEVAEVLVEAMIADTDQNADVAAAMRRAVRGENIGVRDPNQIELF
jgi:hypothetical protein